MSRGWLWPLTPLYAAAVAAKNIGHRRGWLRADRLQWPVISVGNLSVGGAGKTPLVICLAELLAGQGLAVDVLSRGYGRHSKATEVVDAAGRADHFGDEPLLIARRTGVPVVLSASRYAAGLLAEQRLQPGMKAVHLLDDGFQHRRLARNLDIVVVHRSDLEEQMLPAGRLREPLSVLQRADVLVIREEHTDLEDHLRAGATQAPIWRMRRSVGIPTGIGRAMAFCGIARPDEFFHSLQQGGVEIAASRAFSDHQRYSQATVNSLANSAQASGVRCFVTTEKDAVKLEGSLRRRLEQVGPIHVVRLTVSLHDEAAILQYLMERVDGGEARGAGLGPGQV